MDYKTQRLLGPQQNYLQNRFNSCFLPDKGRAPVTFRYTRAGVKAGYHSFKPACAARLCDHVVTSGLPNPASPLE